MKRFFIVPVIFTLAVSIWKLVVFILTPGWINYYEIKRGSKNVRK